MAPRADNDSGAEPLNAHGLIVARLEPDTDLTVVFDPHPVPHVAFEVDDLEAALGGHRVIIEPNGPSRGVIVAFVKAGGAPVELMQLDHEVRPDL